ncbi:unnamed protein product [Rhizophagus irregularis]|nr:unnamed protein product [Rhizophagus irregularis]CAB5350606.1 unnamed protein product [Rhizophagus irregularis]
MESSMTKTLDMTEIFSCWIRGNWSNSELDGCFWIIGRVGLQTLKYGNEFEISALTLGKRQRFVENYLVGLWSLDA